MKRRRRPLRAGHRYPNIGSLSQKKNKPMKHKRLLPAILSLSVTLLSRAQAQSFLTNGLIAYYPFNGNANDESGNGRNGIVVGATLVPDRFNNSGSAFRFVSEGDSIVVPNSLHPQGEVSVTYSCWVRESQSL